jgi:hypothetical protein
MIIVMDYWSYHKVGSKDFILVMSLPTVVLALSLLRTVLCVRQEDVLKLRETSHR